MTPDEFRKNVATVVLSAGNSLTVPSITELTGAYTTLYTRYQELRKALQQISDYRTRVDFELEYTSINGEKTKDWFTKTKTYLHVIDIADKALRGES